MPASATTWSNTSARTAGQQPPALFPELFAAHGLSLPVGADQETETITELQYVTATRT
jgi:hypothetical protein